MPVAERFAVELSLPDYNDLGLFRPEIEPRSHACEANALRLRCGGGYKSFIIVKYLIK